jgi:hypothetical protein
MSVYDLNPQHPKGGHLNKSFLFFFTILILSACTPLRFVLPPGEPAVSPMPPDQPVSNEPGTSMTELRDSYSPQPSDNQLTKGPVYIDSADILILESYPLQYRLVMKGSLPDPCHQLRVVVPQPDEQNVVDVELFSVVDPGSVCIQVLAPFEVSVSLDGFPAGTYDIRVNGDPVGQIDVAAPLQEYSMKGYELYSWKSDGKWFFSLLIGTNRMKTIEEITDPAVQLEGVDALKEQLAKLPAGEYVSWVSFMSEPGAVFPPDAVIGEILGFCVSQGLECQLTKQ